MDSHMPYFIEKKLLIFAFILSVLITNSACRSTIKEPLAQPTLNQYNQIDTLARKDPDSRGIITYDTYQIFVANGKETIAQIATRLDITGEKLALYNGLISNYRPRANEIIAIPENQFISSSGWSTEITQQAIQKKQLISEKVSSASNPLRHRVKQGETVYSLAREYNVSVNSLATWNGLGPDLDIKTGREIIIPAAVTTDQSGSKKKKINQNLPVQSKGLKQPKEKSLKQPVKITNSVNKIQKKSDVISNSAQKNSPPDIKIVSVRPFIAPVNGKIVNKYTQNKGSNNNNGVDYATQPLEAVKVVSDGTILLISDIVGGNGKIILVKHLEELITIYGRLTNISVIKGQEVKQGEKIGEVVLDNKTKEGLMHFEVRKGMKSIDPETMIR